MSNEFSYVYGCVSKCMCLHSLDTADDVWVQQTL